MTLNKRIKKAIAKVGKHHIWSGCMKNGKPFMSIDGKHTNIRKIIYEHKHGKIATNERIIVTCLNIKCVNPGHMKCITVHNLLSMTRATKLNNTIRDYIRRSNKTQQELSKELNVSQATISEIRNYRRYYSS